MTKVIGKIIGFYPEVVRVEIFRNLCFGSISPMKTYKDLFNEVCSFQNLHLAYLKARKCKRYRDEILKFSYNLEENLLKLQEELLSQIYRHGGYREFIVCDSKKRKIKAAPFRDRVVHHALCNIIEPIFNQGFIYDSYACREERGTHKAIKRLESFLKFISEKIFCLQCDISKYFDSINHKILLEIIKRKIGDKKVIWLVEEILNSSYDKEAGRGIPIGNLTSQLFANIYLNELDKFAKHTLKMRYYIRYMDDFLILDYDKRKLQAIKNQIRDFLEDKLKLELHPKRANIFPVEKARPPRLADSHGGRGVDFLGYRIHRTHRLLRKSTVKRFVKRTKKYQKMLNKGLLSKEKFSNSLQSWTTYAEFGNSWRLRKNLSEKLKVKLIE